MARRVRKARSDRESADPGALDRSPPPQVFHRRLAFRRWLSVALLGLLSVVLLSVSFAPWDWWLLAYVALVPWVLAVAGGIRGRSAILWGWLSGLIFWAVNLYWLWWITLAGYAALVAYLSVYWLVAAWLLRRASARRWPTWLVLPVIWVALEYARAYVISGFPWFYLAHTQYAQTRLIQVSDVAGQYGVSFFVAMVNGAVADMLTGPLFVRTRDGRGVPARRHLAGVAACVLAAGALLGYGQWRVSQDSRSPGPVIGVVQEAFPVWLGPTPQTDDPQKQKRWQASSDEIFEIHRLRTLAAFARAGCDLIVWPETVLPKGLNREVLELDLDPEVLELQDARALAAQVVPLRPAAIRNAPPAKLRRFLDLVITGKSGSEELSGPSLRGQARQLEALSVQMGCPILAGGSAAYPNPEPVDDLDRWVTRNSALWFDRSWKNSAQYGKVHLVPMSEYVPCKRSWPWFHKMLRRFIPEVMSQIEPGRDFTRFELERGGRKWRLAAPICYEGTFARVCRRMVVQDGRKAAEILVNISNDGWFVWRWGSWAGQGSAEHAQHLVHYCFRAVENRVPVVRAVNTGISASIDSNGRIVGEVSGPGGRSAMLSGTLLLKSPGADSPAASAPAAPAGIFPSQLPQVLVDTRVSPYSIVGDVFAQAVSLTAIALGAWMLFANRLRKKRATEERARR